MDLRNRSANGIPERILPEDLATEPAHLARYLFACHWVPGRRVADVGCGTGYGTHILAAAGASAVSGFDISQKAIQAARDRFGRETVQFQCVDAMTTPLGPTFDVVVCFEVLEHVTEPGRLIETLSNPLAADGVLLVSTPNAGAFSGGHSGNPHHVREYFHDEFERLLRKRFETVEFYFQWWYRDPFPAWSVRSVLSLFTPLRFKHWLRQRIVSRRPASSGPAPSYQRADPLRFRPYPLAYLTAPGLRGAQPSVWLAVCSSPRLATSDVK